MKRYGFAEGVDAVCLAPHDNGYWFFKNVYDDDTQGVYAVKTNAEGTEILWGPDLLTAPGGWPVLRGTTCTERIDGVFKHPTDADAFWFFSKGQTIKIDWHEKPIVGPVPTGEAWPAIKNNVCDEPDTVFVGGDNSGYWFFKNINNSVFAAKTNLMGDYLKVSGRLEETNWNEKHSGQLSFIDSRFVDHIDAVVKNPDQHWWVFSGEFTAKLNAQSQIVFGPLEIAGVGAWPVLRNV